MEKYQGWSNYATWVTSVLIDSDPRLYYLAKDLLADYSPDSIDMLIRAIMSNPDRLKTLIDHFFDYVDFPEIAQSLKE